MFHKKENHPFIIAGPCSAETEEQVLTIARDLAPLGIDLFRAGIWKPRTRPGAFEGVGAKALPWLRRVKKETGLKTTVEVANANQVYEALKHGVDVLWIGARTTVNPFSIQEIADALQGVDVPVLVKNPVNPDLELWLGAIERLEKAGIQKIGAIHRGFSTFAKTKFRNPPFWEIAIELRRRRPDLAMICDNSHICGNREMLQEVAQQAFDLNYDGLMTETHCDPDNAWSDARQQITPYIYGEMLRSLIVRNENSDDPVFRDNLNGLRQKIDEIDFELMNLLSRRMGLAEEIGLFKSRNNISILQASRWNEILEHAIAQGEKQGLSAEFIEKYLSAIHQESIRRQELVMTSGLEV